MDTELFSALEKKVEALLDAHAALKRENARLSEANCQLLEERNGFKARIDAILKKLEGI
jgi:cell division protein ZapB